MLVPALLAEVTSEGEIGVVLSTSVMFMLGMVGCRVLGTPSYVPLVIIYRLLVLLRYSDLRDEAGLFLSRGSLKTKSAASTSMEFSKVSNISVT